MEAKILEKSSKREREEKNGYKDGYHLHYPYLYFNNNDIKNIIDVKIQNTFKEDESLKKRIGKNI